PQGRQIARSRLHHQADPRDVPQGGDRLRGLITWSADPNVNRRAAPSPLGDRLLPKGDAVAGSRANVVSLSRGTEGSNPSPSSGESIANLIFGCHHPRIPLSPVAFATGPSSSQASPVLVEN